MKEKLDDIMVVVTLSFSDWDFVKKALWSLQAHHAKFGELDRKIGSAMTEAYDKHRKAQA